MNKYETATPKIPSRPCKECGGRPYCAKGLCKKCYQHRRYLLGDGMGRRKQPGKSTKCIECGRGPHKAKGLCYRCYHRRFYIPHDGPHRRRNQGKSAKCTECGAPYHANGLCKECYQQEYRQRPEVKKRASERWRDPEVKARHRERQQSPEIREINLARKRVYKKTPTGRALTLAAKARRRARKANVPHETIDREQVWERYGGKCVYCGESIIKGTEWHLAHLTALSKNGPDLMDNVAPSHPNCNNENGTNPPNKELVFPDLDTEFGAIRMLALSKGQEAVNRLQEVFASQFLE